jgi:hypothetical protein
LETLESTDGSLRLLSTKFVRYATLSFKPAQATKTKKMKNLSIYLFFAMLTGFIFLIAGFILAQVLSYIGGALILESMFWNIILNLIKMTK